MTYADIVECVNVAEYVFSRINWGVVAYAYLLGLGTYVFVKILKGCEK
jgi:hypothetical protein